jgi:hypothetical protein
MLERGEIVEMGSHQELIAEGGLYAGIHQTLTEMELAAVISDDSGAEVRVRGGESP